jgi:hypothetical protein
MSKVFVTKDFGKSFNTVSANQFFSNEVVITSEEGDTQETGKFVAVVGDREFGSFETEDEAIENSISEHNSNQQSFEKTSNTRIFWKLI